MKICVQITEWRIDHLYLKDVQIWTLDDQFDFQSFEILDVKLTH